MSVVLGFPLDEPSANGYELAGRYIAAVVRLERALNAVIFYQVSQQAANHVWNDRDQVKQTLPLRRVLGHVNLDGKCELLEAFIKAGGYEELIDLPALIRRVIRHRHHFAHKLTTLNDDGSVTFFDELKVERLHIPAEEQAALERAAAEAYDRCAALANHTMTLALGES